MISRLWPPLHVSEAVNPLSFEHTLLIRFLEKVFHHILSESASTNKRDVLRQESVTIDVQEDNFSKYLANINYCQLERCHSHLSLEKIPDSFLGESIPRATVGFE